jgi:hypothetical protein
MTGMQQSGSRGFAGQKIAENRVYPVNAPPLKKSIDPIAV